MLGKKVYFRYDPENLSEVRIYDLEDRYIMSVPADNTAVLSYNASKDDVKAAMAKTRRLERIAREYKENAMKEDLIIRMPVSFLSPAVLPVLCFCSW